jgi:predicted regulator of Ras-like GTPase activity (Roadblock/LC7/MglB family)
LEFAPVTTQHKVSSPAGVSLLLSKLMVDAAVRALAAQSSDGQFSWMDGEAEEIDGETLAGVMAGAMSDAESLDWEDGPANLPRTEFEFEDETLVLYLVDPDFVLAAIFERGGDAAALERALGAISGDLRNFL